MAKPSSRAELVNYCLRALGKPVIEINVDDDQVEDRVDEALQFYQEYHADAIIRTYHKHQITATDIENEYITIPEELMFIRNILPINSYGSADNMFSIDYQISLNDMFSINRLTSISSYEMTRQHMALLENRLGTEPGITFNRHRNRLQIHARWGIDLQEGYYIIIDGYNTVNPKDFVDVYNDLFLKKYLIALIKRQWGANLSKFEGVQLPGGVTLNGTRIYEEANTEIEKLEQDVMDKYSEPADFYVG